jgi:hypothetical protein
MISGNGKEKFERTLWDDALLVALNCDDDPYEKQMEKEGDALKETCIQWAATSLEGFVF